MADGQNGQRKGENRWMERDTVTESESKDMRPINSKIVGLARILNYYDKFSGVHVYVCGMTDYARTVCRAYM